MIFKMEADTLLTNSNFCRLCSEKNSNGINLFTLDDRSEDLCSLVNRYLPVKIENEDSFPKTICPGCHIQLEATKLFMDLIIEGQGKLRSLLKAQQDILKREEKERLNLEQALQNHNPNASVGTYTIKSDENGEKYLIQIYSEGPLFSSEHELALRAGGLDKPKRKRGRPPKPMPTEETYESTEGLDPSPELIEPESLPAEESNNRHKRKIRPPARYDGVVQGKELVKILKKEGVIDDDSEILEEEVSVKDEANFTPEKVDLPVGTVVTADGDLQVEQLIFMKTKPRINRVRKKGSAKKFSCDICNKKFQHPGRCEIHKRGHHVKYACQGEACSVQDKNKEAIVEHQKETGHGGISTFEPINKINGMVVLDVFSEPSVSEPSADPLSSDPFSTDPLSTAATELDRKNKSLKCEKCSKMFSCKQNYKVHMKAIHEGEKTFKCDTCQKEFAYACSLKNHMIIHKQKGAGGVSDGYLCDICEKIFQHPSSLMYHKDTEHGNRRFICNKCNKSFKHRQLLLRHQAVHSEDRPFKCGDCGRQFKSKTNLVNHENIHKGVKKFVCPVCGNTFLHKTSLWVHLKWHEGNKPYECSVCKKAFSQKGNLMEHQRIHTGEKPFTCNECGRSFTTSSQCKLHMKRHTGEKPYGCQYCQKHFLHKETYESHIRRHLGERPFHCKFCPKSFPEDWACTRHERIHLGLKKYKCEVCNKTFSDGSNYTKHKRIHVKNGTKPEVLEQKPDEAVANVILESGSTSMGIELLADTEAKKKDVPAVVTPPDIQFHDLLDHEGNAISITTADGQPIPIVSSGDEKFQGLMPDGTLVTFDILSNQEDKGPQEEAPAQITAASEVNLINTEIQFLEDSNSISNVGEEKPAFMSEDGKVCFITAFDENAFLTMS